jgi:hypothetical protein
MKNYRITVIATVTSSLPKKDLESRLVASLFDVETEHKASDGEGSHLQIVDYELTEAVPI